MVRLDGLEPISYPLLGETGCPHGQPVVPPIKATDLFLDESTRKVFRLLVKIGSF